MKEQKKVLTKLVCERKNEHNAQTNVLNGDGSGESDVFKQNLWNRQCWEWVQSYLEASAVSHFYSKNRDQDRIIQVSPGAECSLALRFIRLTSLLQTVLGPIATRHLSTQFNPATLKNIDFGVSLEVVPCPCSLLAFQTTGRWSSYVFSHLPQHVMHALPSNAPGFLGCFCVENVEP